MENKRLKEQIAFDYRGQLSSRPANDHHLSQGRVTGATGRARGEGQSTASNKGRRRVVTMPHEIVQPTPWADRQAHKRRAHPEPRARSRVVKRTLAHTGKPASEGQVRLIWPLPRQSIAVQVPVRSGRQHVRRGSFWQRLLTLLALLVIAILGGSFAFASPNFRVQQVEIVGTQNQRLVGNIQNMGVQGQNIFLLDVAALTSRIEALPTVASVSIAKQLPDQVIVNVVERRPVLLWQTRPGTFSVDSQGVVIAPAESSDTNHLMTVVDLRERVAQQVYPGALLNKADIAFAMQVFARLPQLTGLSSFTLRYDVVPQQGGHKTFIVASSDGWLAYLGDVDDSNPLDNRLIELQQILSLAQQKQLNLATIDLRFGLRPVYTLKT